MELDTYTETPIQTFYPGPLFDPLGLRGDLRPLAGVPPYGLSPHAVDLGGCGLESSELRFEVDSAASFFGDCIRVIDEPEEQSLAPGLPTFGWSGEQLLSGSAMTAARLHGELVIRFGRTNAGQTPFVIDRSSRLIGDDGVLAAPDGYELPVADNEVSLIDPESRGALELGTGRVYDFHFNCRFRNTAIRALLELNPSLEEPPLLFPGLPHGGHALAWFTLSEDGVLCFRLAAQLFLPLGAGTAEDPLTMPASASQSSHQATFLARNSSLHPYIFLACRQRAVSGPPQAPRKRQSQHQPGAIASILAEHQNTTLRLICWPKESYFGDDFDMVSAELGGGARAQSPLFGSMDLQLGKIVDGFAPFRLTFSSPSPAYEAKFGSLLALLPPGTRPGLVGLSGDLAFPKQLYRQRNLSLNTDPYKVSIGIVEIDTGKIRSAVLRKFLFQDLMLALLHIEPRTPSDSFAYSAEGAFQLVDGHISLDLDGALVIPYPTGYRFPLPDGGATVAEDGSQLTPFLRLVAIETAAFLPASLDGQLRFSGDEHIRGYEASNISFEITPGDTSNVVGIGLALDDAQVRGSGELPREVSQADRRLVTGEFTREDDSRACCTYYLTITNQGTDLQLVCTNEDLDLWFRGKAAAVPSAVGGATVNE
jgi:hypothetical protein